MKMRYYNPVVYRLFIAAMLFSSGALAQTAIPVSSTAVTRLHGPNSFSPYKQAISLEGNAKNGTGWATHAIDWTGAGSVAWQLESAGGEYGLQVCYQPVDKVPETS